MTGGKGRRTEALEITCREESKRSGEIENLKEMEGRKGEKVPRKVKNY